LSWLSHCISEDAPDPDERNRTVKRIWFPPRETHTNLWAMYLKKNNDHRYPRPLSHSALGTGVPVDDIACIDLEDLGNDHGPSRILAFPIIPRNEGIRYQILLFIPAIAGLFFFVYGGF
jgi:hypothetical protein